MTFWGELTDGTELLLGEPMEAQLLYDSDAPASQLRAVFPAEKQWEDLAVVRVFHQGQVAFGGIVDEQNTALSGEGFTVELIARSWEALLLDNEARPAVLRSPSLGLLWERYFQPLGLTSVVGDQSPKAGELAVEKGTSCWELLESFCRDYLGTAPWVDGKGTLHCEGPQETKVIAGRVLSAELSRLPCAVERCVAAELPGHLRHALPGRGGGKAPALCEHGGRPGPSGAAPPGGAGELASLSGVPGQQLARPRGAGHSGNAPPGPV